MFTRRVCARTVTSRRIITLRDACENAWKCQRHDAGIDRFCLKSRVFIDRVASEFFPLT